MGLLIACSPMLALLLTERVVGAVAGLSIGARTIRARSR